MCVVNEKVNIRTISGALRVSMVTSTYFYTSRMIANFIVEGPGNVAKPFVDKSIQSSTGLGGLPIARNLASHWGTME